MNSNRARILVVEDDRDMRDLIDCLLEQEGLSCSISGSGQDALNALVSERFDLMLLDLGLPDLDGMEVLRRVREWSEMPVIVVTARDQAAEKVAALDAGADDYLVKPFCADELLARIHVALRHLDRQASDGAQNILRTGGLQIDLSKRVFYVDGRETHLTPMEYGLLALFFRNIGKVLTTGYILKEIWGSDGGDTQALRALMAALRRKIEKTPAEPRYIRTEIGVGYRLIEE